jgi:diguanylate cyclase (GGDEF)-like protein
VLKLRMNDRIVIFLKKNLEKCVEIINRIKNIAPFGVEFVSIQDLTTEKFHTIIKETSQAHIYFAIDPVNYKENQKHLNIYLKSIFELPFSNYIYIYQDTQFMNEHTFLLGQSVCYYFSKDHDHEIQARSYIVYQIQLFEKAIISTRLTEYITDSFKEVVYSEILAKKNKEIKQLYDELEEKNRIDYLTNLYNRKALFDLLEKERKRTDRALWRLQELKDKEEKNTYAGNTFTHNPEGIITDHLGIYSIIMIDIDNFKKVNDTYGHLIGDRVLKALGDLILQDNILRENDMAGRFGGEEFVIILPETNAHNAYNPAMRLMDKFKNTTFSGKNGEHFSVTLSIGISEYNNEDKTNDDIIQRADKALYLAKDQGKGKVIIYEDSLVRFTDDES